MRAASAMSSGSVSVSAKALRIVSTQFFGTSGGSTVGTAQLGAGKHEAHERALLVRLGVIEHGGKLRSLRSRRFLGAQQEDDLTLLNELL